MKYCQKCRTAYPNEFNVCPIDNSTLGLTSELLPGMVIRGKYLIDEKIGEGGMGVVYRARHLAFNEILALKVVHALLAEDASLLKRFKTEAIVTRRLQHPNAVRIHDLDSTEDGRPFIVMELVEGGSLKDLIARTGPLSVGRAVAIATQTADALAAAHNLGIVHRDIKPDNILLADNDFVKVADFGIARVREGTLGIGTGHTATGTGMFVGTPQYLSPEQAAGKTGDHIDGRADIYSLGMVLYVMLTGQLPFDSDTPMGFLMHHMHTQPVPPHVVRPDLRIPSRLSGVLMKALEKDREKRFATADDMASELRQMQELTPSQPQSAPHRRITPSPVRLPGDVRPSGVQLGKRWRSIWLVAGALLIAGALGLGLYVREISNLADKRIRTEVSRSLGDLKDTSILVKVRSGIVTLSGTAPDRLGQDSATKLAAKVSGVKSVNNEMTVSVRPDSFVDVTSQSPSPPAAQESTFQAASPPSPQKAPTSIGLARKMSSAQIQQLIAAGNEAADNGSYDSAIASFQKAQEADPHNTAAQEGLRRAKQAKQTERLVLR